MQKLNLLGDSQLLRAEAELRRHTVHTKYQINSVVAQSGITISQLKFLVKQRQLVLEPGSTSLVFIGTNDIKQRRTYNQIKTDYLSLVKFLKRRLPTDALLVFTTLPLFPLFSSDPCIASRIFNVNKFIVSTKASNVTYIKWEFRRELQYYFQKCYGNNIRRVDLLHLNQKGFQLLFTALNALCDPEQET